LKTSDFFTKYTEPSKESFVNTRGAQKNYFFILSIFFRSLGKLFLNYHKFKDAIEFYCEATALIEPVVTNIIKSINHKELNTKEIELFDFLDKLQLEHAGFMVSMKKYDDASLLLSKIHNRKSWLDDGVVGITEVKLTARSYADLKYALSKKNNLNNIINDTYFFRIGEFDGELICCGSCGNFENLTECAYCKKIYYCSGSCQHSDWHNHKIHCEQK